MTTRRQRQVAELLHEEISNLLQHNTRDPRLGFVTVTGVEVSADLQNALVFVTVLGDETDAQNTLKGLASAAGYFRHQLGKTLSLRRIPELRFKIDVSLERGTRIEALLESINPDAEQDQSLSGIETDG